MVRTGYLFGIFLVLLWIGSAGAQQPLKFTQIVNTPDQAIGALIIKAAYEKLDIPVEFVILPGKRALAESSGGRADGEVHRIIEVGDDYPTLLRVPTPINYIEPSVFAKSHEFEVTDCAALQNYQIGIVRGVKHSQLCTQGMRKIFVGDDLTSVMRMLNAGRVELLITARINGLLIAKKLGLEAVNPLSPPLSRFWVYHYLHESHKELVPAIDNVFKAMQESGELEALRKQAVEELLHMADKKD